MARQFRGAAKGRGFNPIPISGANITRMREENDRILRGLKERRESQRENEKRHLDAMQANAAYYERVRSRDYQTASTNVKNEMLQAQYDATAQANRAEQNEKVVTELFSAVADFSQTAAKMALKAEDKRKKEEKQLAEQILAENGYLTASTIKFGEVKDEEAFARAVQSQLADQARDFGVPELQVQQIMSMGVEGSLALAEALVKLETQNSYSTYRSKALMEAGVDLSKPDEVKAALPEIWFNFKKDKGIDKFLPELMAGGLKVKNDSDQTFNSGLESIAAEDLKAQNIENNTNIALANWDVNGQDVAHHIWKITGRAGAMHDWVVMQFKSMNAEGDFYLNDKQLENFSVMPDGQPYYIPPGKSVTVNGKTWTTGSHQNRGVQALNGREDKRREWDRGVAADDRLSYTEESKAWHRHIVMGGNIGDIGAAIESFKDNVQGIPEWLRKLKHAGHSSQGSYNANLITTAKDLQARGMLYPSIIKDVNARDPKLANELQASYEKQDPFMRDNMYKKNFEAIENLPLVMDSNGNYPAPSSAANKATAFLQEAYRQLVERAVADGAEIKDAAYTSLKAIEDGFAKSDSPFSRVYNANTAQYDFPELYTKTPQEIAEEIDQADKQFLKNLDAGYNKTKLKQSMFAQPEIVLTSSQYDQQIVDMKSPGFTFHPRIDMLVQSGAADSHMAALALVGAAQKKPPIVPPPSLQVTSEYSPGANRMLAKWGSRSPNIEARAHGAGQQNLVPEAGLALVPVNRIPNLREFYRASAERHGVSPAENAAMGEIESNHGTANLNDKGISVSYNGTSEGVMQINRSAHSDFYAQHNGNPSHEANIEYGTKYYAEKKREFNGDAIAASMAYNGGSGHYRAWLAGKKPAWVTNPKQTPKEREDSEKEWVRIVDEMVNHGTKFAKAYYKYSGDASLLQHPLVLRK